MKYIVNIVLGVLIITLIGLIVWKTKKSEKDLDFGTAKPVIADIENIRYISGNVYPCKEIEIKSPISGVLDEVFVKIGDKVKPGDAIAKIKLVPNPSDLERFESNLVTANIEFENKKSIYVRNKSLFENKVISESDFEDIKKAFDLANQQYQSAQDQLRLLKEGVINNLNISNVVKTSINGNVIDLPLKEGASVIERNYFNDGSTIALIAQLDSFIFRGKVNETDISLMNQGMQLKLNFNAYKNVTVNAFLNKISAKGIEEQGIIKYIIEAKFGMNKTLPILRSGYSATAKVLLQKKEKILTIDEKLLQFENDSVFVEVVDAQNKLEKRFILTGISDGTNIEVVNGLRADERIKIIN